MSDIDFQNGLIVGLAARGMVKSGITYQPRVWNDEGVYDYFYIDFKRGMEPFSLGMFEQSIIIHDSDQLYATGIQKVSNGVYKVFCDISGRVQGITVLNKKTSLLMFATGQRLPPFSIHFFVAGIASYERLRYCYEEHVFKPLNFEGSESCSIDTTIGVMPVGAYEIVTHSTFNNIINESANILLT